MEVPLKSTQALAEVVRAARKAQKIQQDDAAAAGAIGVSENFVGKIERGGETAQWSKLYQVLEGLGIHVILDVPDDIAHYLDESMPSESKP